MIGGAGSSGGPPQSRVSGWGRFAGRWGSKRRRKAAEVLGPAFDLEVIEMHHRMKKDAPSGTARTLGEILAETGRSPEESAYVGDDIVDIPLLRQGGFAASVADAEEYVRSEADYVSSRRGGQGAVREIIEFVLKSCGAWDRLAAKYLDGGGTD